MGVGVDVAVDQRRSSSMVEAAVPAKRSEKRESSPTLLELGTWQLVTLATVSDELLRDLPRIVEAFGDLLGTSATRRAGGVPAYASDVVDDHTPFEMSIAVGGDAPELRLLVEPVRGDSSLAGRWS